MRRRNHQFPPHSARPTALWVNKLYAVGTYVPSYLSRGREGSGRGEGGKKASLPPAWISDGRFGLSWAQAVTASGPLARSSSGPAPGPALVVSVFWCALPPPMVLPHRLSFQNLVPIICSWLFTVVTHCPLFRPQLMERQPWRYTSLLSINISFEIVSTTSCLLGLVCACQLSMFAYLSWRH